MNDKIFTKRFILVFGAQFSVAMVMYTLMATITEYASSMGTTAMLAGLVSGIYVFGGLCSRLYSGRAMETIGRKRLAVIFLTIHGIACIFYFLVDNIWMLLFVRFVHGIGFGASANATATIGMSILPEKRFSEACGYFMMSTTLAVGVGPYFGGIIYDQWGSTGCFIMATLLGFLSMALIFFVDIHDVDPAKRECNENVQAVEVAQYHGINGILDVKALPISLVTGLSALGYVSVMSFYRLYAEETNLSAVFGKFFLLYAFILLFSRPLAGKLQDKYGDKIVCYPGILMQTAGLLLLALCPNPLTVILCAVGCAFGYGTLNSACNAIACRSVPVERRSYAVTAFYICCDVAMGIGPALLGAIITMSGSYQLMYIAAAGITLIGLPICIKVLKR